MTEKSGIQQCGSMVAHLGKHSKEHRAERGNGPADVVAKSRAGRAQ